ncbi:MAG: hypothetical protein ACI9DJ_002401 [Algoriphagus sp.]|jgi:hypothetical protein
MFFLVLIRPARGIGLGNMFSGSIGTETSEQRVLYAMYPDFDKLEVRGSENKVLKFDNLIKNKITKIVECVWSLRRITL